MPLHNSFCHNSCVPDGTLHGCERRENNDSAAGQTRVRLGAVQVMSSAGRGDSQDSGGRSPSRRRRSSSRRCRSFSQEPRSLTPCSGAEASGSFGVSAGFTGSGLVVRALGGAACAGPPVISRNLGSSSGPRGLLEGRGGGEESGLAGIRPAGCSLGFAGLPSSSQARGPTIGISTMIKNHNALGRMRHCDLSLVMQSRTAKINRPRDKRKATPYTY